MNISDKKDKLLFQVMEKYDDTVNSFFKVHKKDNGDIINKFNYKYFGSWFFLLFYIIYLISLLLFIFNCTKIFYPLIILDTLLLIIFIVLDEKQFKKKIREITGIDNNTNYYDLFVINVRDFSSSKLKFLIKYICFLNKKKIKLDKYASVLSFIIAFGVNILTMMINEKQLLTNTILNTIMIGLFGILFINSMINIFYYKNNKLLKLKNFIRYVLLSKDAEDINLT